MGLAVEGGVQLRPLRNVLVYRRPPQYSSVLLRVLERNTSPQRLIERRNWKSLSMSEVNVVSRLWGDWP